MDTHIHTGGCQHSKPYGFWSFIFDAIMVMITCGFWFIWIFVREMRKR